MLERSRLSFGSVEAQTAQGQATMGTPVLVPVPKKVIFKGGLLTRVKLAIVAQTGGGHLRAADGIGTYSLR